MRQGNPGTVYFLLGDHLGSTAKTYNAATGATTELRYHPWGGTRFTSGTTPTARRYTGQIEDAAIGLYFYNARYYDSALGRFIQADTIVPSPANPQSYNRYAYTLNNPLRYTDPTGHIPSVGIFAAIGAATGFVVYAATTNSFDRTEALLATATMAAAGALIGSGVGLAAGAQLASGVLIGAGVGAASSGISEMVVNGLTGQEFDAVGYMCSVGGGAVSGAATALVPGVGLAPTAARSIIAGSVGATQYAVEQSIKGDSLVTQDALLSFGAAAAGQFVGEQITARLFGTPSEKAAMTHFSFDDFRPQGVETSPIYYQYYTKEWSDEQFIKGVRAGGQVFRDTTLNIISGLFME